MSPLGRRLLVSMHAQALEAQLATQSVALENQVTTWAASGLETAAIKALIVDRMQEVVDRARASVMREIEAGINQITFSSYWKEVAGSSDYFRWEMEPTAKHCDTCLDRDGKVGTGAEMEAVGLPGAGTTDCNIGCRCRIVPITKDEYDAGEVIE